MFKKILNVIMVLVLILSLAACGKATTVDETFEDTSTEVKTEATTAKDDFKMARGSQSVTEYVNESVNIRFPLSNFGTILTDEQISQLKGYSYENSLVSDMYTDEQINKVDAGTVYDFIGYLPDGKSNVIVLYENMNVTVGKPLTTQNYLNAVLQQLKTIGYEFEHTAKKVELAGEEYMMISGNYEGMTQTYYGKVFGNYFFGMIVTTIDMNKFYEEQFISTVTTAR